MTDRELIPGMNRNLSEHREPCPKCGAPMQLRHAKKKPGQSQSNAFWGCTAYPQCDHVQPLHEKSDFEPQSLPGEFCPQCESPLLLKKGRYGFFVGCSAFPDCHYMLDPNAPAEEEAPACPSCQKGHLVQRASRYGKSFYACDTYPNCKYSLNEQPIPRACPECGWGVLVKHKQHGRTCYKCPQKSCGYRTDTC
ncbi:MAG: puttaive DNA topoisomerase YrdD [Idiomarinaceae bacterium HL-53]|nr:MAG: puttaive DNA topoisomerase YrdD [Idiomarinaceae bacterium HL-53]CUS47786.1 putative DNA topoisomerase [Idiomarinaceae bacterium HL-53]